MIPRANVVFAIAVNRRYINLILSNRHSVNRLRRLCLYMRAGRVKCRCIIQSRVA